MAAFLQCCGDFLQQTLRADQATYNAGLVNDLQSSNSNVPATEAEVMQQQYLENGTVEQAQVGCTA